MKEFILKYFWVILIIGALVGGFFIRGIFIPSDTLEDLKLWKKHFNELQEKHKKDSIESAKIISYWKALAETDSLRIVEIEQNYKLIKKKYEKELNRINSFNANESLWFFAIETNIDPD